MAQSADAGDHDPFAGPRLGLLDALVRRDACADERRGFARCQTCRDVGDVVRVRHDVFGKATVLRVAAELRFGAHGLACREAKLAVTAGGIEPGHADTVALLDRRHARAESGDNADTLVPGVNGNAGFNGQSPIRGMQIGVADAAGFGLDQNLAGTGRPEYPSSCRTPAVCRTVRRRQLAFSVMACSWVAMGSAC
jgi:hypothetical protein